jgi:hypothetical protein
VSRPVRFTTSDIERALKVASKVGLRVAGYEIEPNGTIRILTGEPEADDDWRVGSPLYRNRAA